MLIKKILRGELDDVFFIILWLFFSVLFSYFLLRGIIEQPLSIENMNNIIWITVCTVQILKSRKKILHIPSADNFDSEVKETIGINKPIEKMALAVLVIICLVPILSILWINRDALTAPYTIDPEFAVFGIYVNISAGLLLIVSDLENIIDIQSKVVKQLLQLLGIAFAITAFVMLVIYSSHIT